jgi:SAM-dependent methyltransferase
VVAHSSRLAPPSTRPLSLPARAWFAWRCRGARYVWHKALRRTPGSWTEWKRRLIYAEPRAYWTHRGGHDYFREQEGQPERTARAEWIAERIASYRPDSVLEIGCGYGKQLRALRARLGDDVLLVGVDFSSTQLAMARQYLDGLGGIELLLASGTHLPFVDGGFDLVLTSAVLLHNPPAAAELIRCEVIRIARRFAVHNEDTSISYNRYGYDTAAWYRAAGIPLVESGPIPNAPAPASTQFCVALPWLR